MKKADNTWPLPIAPSDAYDGSDDDTSAWCCQDWMDWMDSNNDVD